MVSIDRPYIYIYISIPMVNTSFKKDWKKTKKTLKVELHQTEEYSSCSNMPIKCRLIPFT